MRKSCSSAIAACLRFTDLLVFRGSLRQESSFDLKNGCDCTPFLLRSALTYKDQLRRSVYGLNTHMAMSAENKEVLCVASLSNNIRRRP
jgi:hypothetical protein